MSVLDGFENTKRVVEEKLCAKLVFEGIEIDISRRLIYRGTHVEVVCQLINQNTKAKHHVNVGVDAEDYYKIKEGK